MLNFCIKMKKKAPLVVDLLTDLSTLKVQRGMTFISIIRLLNQHLPVERQIPKNPQGTTQLERWMKTDREGWAEPSGEIILAIQEVLNDKGLHPLVDET